MTRNDVNRPLSLWPPRGRRDLALNVVEQTWLHLPPPSSPTIREQQRRHDRHAHVPINSKKELQELLPSSTTKSLPSSARHLGGSNSNDGYSSYLVDEDGNELEPYSLAWRYLGMYIDCDADEQEQGGEAADGDQEEGRGRQRHLSGSGDGDGDCERVLLWAAYRNPKYKGNAIGEYKFFNIETFKWNKSTCQKRRGCRKLDCHEKSTKWELVGVFKEYDGLEDWAEQLFKHQAYCLWDEDTYENMQSWREEWPNECEYMEYLLDSEGNNIYTHLKPEYGGSISMGLYIDDKCTIESVNTYFDYVNAYYVYYVSEDEAPEAVQTWIDTINGWNDAMDLFKICQPCRAYSLNPSQQNQDDDSSSDEKRRFLEDNENDGEGEEEPFGYNCYDDAGYTNCNQCYKFETQTDMEAASVDDLARATAQGSILRVNVDGETYGNGGFRSRKTDFGKLMEDWEGAIIVASLLVSTASIALIMLLMSLRKSYKRGRNRNTILKEKFLDDGEGPEPDSTTRSPEGETEVVGSAKPNKPRTAMPVIRGRRGRSRTRVDRGRSRKRSDGDSLDAGESSSFSDVSAATDPGGESTDRLFSSFKLQFKTFLSVWKSGIKRALYHGGGDDESYVESSDGEDYDDSEDSQSRDSRSTITRSSNAKTTPEYGERKSSRRSKTETGYVPPQTLTDSSSIPLAQARTVPSRNPRGEAAVSGHHDSDEDNEIESIESNPSESSGDNDEQFYDELFDKILSEKDERRTNENDMP